MPFKVTDFGINRKPICDFLLVNPSLVLCKPPKLTTTKFGLKKPQHYRSITGNDHGCSLSLEPVSYTHLTLPTIYSV